MSGWVRRAGAGAALLLIELILASPGPVSAQNAAPPPAATPVPGGVPVLGGAPAPAPPAKPPPPPEPAWLPRRSAELQILDKVDATHETLNVAVGSSVKVGDLTIAVKACLVRPPDRERDAAAYVGITGRDPAVRPFRGWLLAAEPAVSTFEHPIYDVRVTGCG
jgi:hypothetical protein